MVLSKDMKIAICFGLIMGALISICNMCFASETVETYLVSDISISNYSSEFSSSSGSSIRYILLEHGYKYSIDFGSQRRVVVLSQEIPSVGVAYDNLGSYIGLFEYSAIGDVYLALSYNGSSSLNVTREPLQGMTSFVDSLAYDLSYANLNGVIFFVVPIMAIAILFVLGLYLLKRLLNRINRAKGGV